MKTNQEEVTRLLEAKGKKFANLFIVEEDTCFLNPGNDEEDLGCLVDEEIDYETLDVVASSTITHCDTIEEAIEYLYDGYMMQPDC